MTRPRIIIAGCSRRLRSHEASENSERHQPLIEKPLPQTSRFFPGRRGDYRLGWQCAGIPDRLRDHRDLVDPGARLRLFRHVATHHQYGNVDYHVSHGFLDPEDQNRDTRAVRLKMG